MANYDLSALALKMVCPNNHLITDDKGLPGAYVYRAKKMLSELLTDGDASIVHPAFMIEENQKPGQKHCCQDSIIPCHIDKQEIGQLRQK